MLDPYTILGLEPGADLDAIKKAYRAKAKQWHPDVNPAPDAADRFKEVAAAFEILGDPVRRRSHDAAAGRVSRGELPQAFVDQAMSAIERAQTYAERVVVPAYARHWRGAGAEMAARLWRDLESLADPGWLQETPRAKDHRRATQLLDGVHVTMELWPSSTLSTVHRGFDGTWVIQLTPWALNKAGFTDAAAIDDAMLRIVLARVAQVVAHGRFWAVEDPESWDVVLAEARARDTAVLKSTWTKRLVYGGLATFILLLLTSGFLGW